MDAEKNIIEIAKNKGYYVDCEGNAFSRFRKLKLILNSKGYYYINIKIDSKVRPIYIHRLQAFQKFGKDMFKNKIEVRHLNSVQSDNTYKNIAIGTRIENRADMSEEQRIELGKRLKNAVNTDNLRKYNYDQIKTDREAGMSNKDILLKYNIDFYSALNYILKSISYGKY